VYDAYGYTAHHPLRTISYPTRATASAAATPNQATELGGAGRSIADSEDRWQGSPLEWSTTKIPSPGPRPVRHTRFVTETRFDREAYKVLLEQKLVPARIRSTLAFAGLYQLTHELIKDAVLDGVQTFYVGMEAQYAVDVLSLAPKNRFRSSLLWLVGCKAITEAQADRLDAVYEHRHDLTHELGKYIVDPDFEPNFELFVEALDILGSIHRFWTQIEIDISGLGVKQGVTVDDMVPGAVLLLRMCIDAYIDGLPAGAASRSESGDAPAGRPRR
jgi:hypothetical protein